MGDIADMINEDGFGRYWDEGSGGTRLLLPITELVTETGKAWLVDGPDLAVPEWFPKSQCELNINPLTGHGTMTVPEWLLDEKDIYTGDLEEV